LCLNRKTYKDIYVCRESAHNKYKEGVKCTADMTVEIKLLTTNTKKKDIFLRASPPPPGVITVRAVHNHSTETAPFLTRLHPSLATKRRIDDLFVDGHGPSSARAACIDMVKVTSGQPAVSVVHGNLVPTKNSIAHSYRKFRTDTIGTHSTDEQLEKLREKVTAYEKTGKFTVYCKQCSVSGLMCCPSTF